MLFIPPCGPSALDQNIGDSSTEYGTVVTGGSAHVKGSYVELHPTRDYDSYGLVVMVGDTEAKRGLVDIAIGGAGSEVIIIDNLLAGHQAGTSNSFNLGGSCYFFPIFVAASARLSARAQSSTGGGTCRVAVWLHQHPVQGKWYGRRVKTYGADTATSSGTSMSPGNNTYATDVALSGSTADKIRYIQIGTDLLTGSATTSRGLARLTVDAAVIAADLPYVESSFVVGHTNFSATNLILSKMYLNLPSGISLEISAMRNTAAAARGWIAYGVD